MSGERVIKYMYIFNVGKNDDLGMYFRFWLKIRIREIDLDLVVLKEVDLGLVV